jgi:hypothetical protein
VVNKDWRFHKTTLIFILEISAIMFPEERDLHILRIEKESLALDVPR